MIVLKIVGWVVVASVFGTVLSVLMGRESNATTATMIAILALMKAYEGK